MEHIFACVYQTGLDASIRTGKQTTKSCAFGLECEEFVMFGAKPVKLRSQLSVGVALEKPACGHRGNHHEMEEEFCAHGRQVRTTNLAREHPVQRRCRPRCA